MNEVQTLLKDIRDNRYLVGFSALGVLLLALILAVAVTESRRPGYGWGSYLLKTPESFVASKAKEDARIADEKAAKEKLAAEQEEIFAKSEALKQFTKLNVMKVSFKVKCPNPETWRTLSDDDKRLLREQLFKQNTLLFEGRVCP